VPIKHSQSAPGQLAAAIKKADPRSRAGMPRPAAVIDHGHGEGGPAAPAQSVGDVLAQLTGQDSRIGKAGQAGQPGDAGTAATAE
jgi:hypothetical protein